MLGTLLNILLRALRVNAVPVFMLISFVISDDKFFQHRDGYTKKRVLRLWLPFFIWNSVYLVVVFAINSILQLSVTVTFMISRHSAKINSSMWFIAVQIAYVGIMRFVVNCF